MALKLPRDILSRLERRRILRALNPENSREIDLAEADTSAIAQDAQPRTNEASLPVGEEASAQSQGPTPWQGGRPVDDRWTVLP